jgi:predicted MFS family arabinose efflux permease
VTDPRLLTRTFVLLTVAELGYFLSVGISIQALPLYATEYVGTTEAGAGLAFGAFGITALFCRPLVGRAADHWGRRRLLVAGAGLAGVGMALLPLVDSLTLVVVIRLLQGVAEAAFVVAAFALLADIAPPARLGEALSYNSLGLYLGISAGPPIGEFLGEQWGWEVVWGGAALLNVVAVVLAFALIEPPLDTSAGGHSKFIHRPAIAPSIGFFTSLAAIGGFLAFASLHSKAIGMDNTSAALATYGVVVVVGRVVFARVPDRFPPLKLGAASLVAIGVGLGMAALWNHPWAFLVGAVVLGLGVTFSTPAFFAAVFATARPAERGAASGTISICMDLGFGFGPIMLGVVAHQAGISTAFAVGAAIAAAGAAWTWRLTRQPVVIPPLR